jgi:hypothetical protein
MIGIVKKEIQGKFNKYTELRSLQGYCFYDADETERQYITSVLTPITNEAELARKYVAVYGDADKLNEELRKQRVVEVG